MTEVAIKVTVKGDHVGGPKPLADIRKMVSHGRDLRWSDIPHGRSHANHRAIVGVTLLKLN